jgi:hypothetical protein
LLDARGPIGLTQWGLVCWIGTKRFGHPMKTCESIMGQSPSWVNELDGSRQLPTANAQRPTTPNSQRRSSNSRPERLRWAFKVGSHWELGGEDLGVVGSWNLGVGS